MWRNVPGIAPGALPSPVPQLHYRVCGPGKHLRSQDLPCPPCLENHHSDTRWDLEKGPFPVPSPELRYFHHSQQFLALLATPRENRGNEVLDKFSM